MISVLKANRVSDKEVSTNIGSGSKSSIQAVYHMGINHECNDNIYT